MPLIDPEPFQPKSCTAPEVFAGLPTTYQPEVWRVKKDSIYAAISSLESAIEYVAEHIAEHDARLGRTTPRNNSYAVCMEKDLKKMKDALFALRSEPISRE